MPIDCPDCGRSNHERLDACLYCGALLPRPEDAARLGAPDEVSHPGASEAALEPDDREAGVGLGPSRRQWLLVLDRGGDAVAAAPSADQVNAVAQALETDAYLARKHLTSRQPSVVARSDEPERLTETATRLAAQGLVVTRISPAELAQVGEPWTAVGLAPANQSAGSPGAVCFVRESERELVAPGDTTLVIQGTLLVSTPDSSDSSRGLGTALQWSSPSREALEQLRSDFPLVEIHRRDRPRIRFCLAEFDFTGLEERKRPSALLNLKLLIRDLMAASPLAAFDDHFRFVAPEFDAGAGLLGLPSTNEQQFDRYARTLAVHRRKLAAGETFGGSRR